MIFTTKNSLLWSTPSTKVTSTDRAELKRLLLSDPILKYELTNLVKRDINNDNYYDNLPVLPLPVIRENFRHTYRVDIVLPKKTDKHNRRSASGTKRLRDADGMYRELCELHKNQSYPLVFVRKLGLGIDIEYRQIDHLLSNIRTTHAYYHFPGVLSDWYKRMFVPYVSKHAELHTKQSDYYPYDRGNALFLSVVMKHIVHWHQTGQIEEFITNNFLMLTDNRYFKYLAYPEDPEQFAYWVRCDVSKQDLAKVFHIITRFDERPLRKRRPQRLTIKFRVNVPDKEIEFNISSVTPKLTLAIPIKPVVLRKYRESLSEVVTEFSCDIDINLMADIFKHSTSRKVHLSVVPAECLTIHDSRFIYRLPIR